MRLVPGAWPPLSRYAAAVGNGCAGGRPGGRPGDRSLPAPDSRPGDGADDDPGARPGARSPRCGRARRGPAPWAAGRPGPPGHPGSRSARLSAYPRPPDRLGRRQRPRSDGRRVPAGRLLRLPSSAARSRDALARLRVNTSTDEQGRGRGDDHECSHVRSFVSWNLARTGLGRRSTFSARTRRRCERTAAVQAARTHDSRLRAGRSPSAGRARAAHARPGPPLAA